MSNRLLLKLGVGLTAVFLTGFSLVFIIFRASPDSASKVVFRGKIEMPRQTFKINAQPRSGDIAGQEGGATGPDKKKLPIEAQKSQSPAAQLAEGQIAAPAASKPTEEFSSIRIGPIITEQELKKATGFLHRNGYDFEQLTGMGTVKVTRLLDGVYPREKARKRLKELQGVVDTAFVIPEKEKLAIYVATYRDPAKAIERTKNLAQKNINVTAVATEIEMAGTILVIKQAVGSNIETITNRMSQMGLSVNINK